MMVRPFAAVLLGAGIGVVTTIGPLWRSWAQSARPSSGCSWFRECNTAGAGLDQTNAVRTVRRRAIRPSGLSPSGLAARGRCARIQETARYKGAWSTDEAANFECVE